MSEPDQGQGTRSRNPLGPDFSALLAGTFVTNFGDGLRLAALPLMATTLTSSPLLIGGLTAAQFLPWATFAPLGGVIVDRADRRRLIVVTQAWRSLVMAALAVAVVLDTVSVWHLFVVAFMITVGEILVDPSVVATVPTLVPMTELDKANGQITTVQIVTNNFVGGPVGAASFGIAPWLPFVLDAVSYAGSIGPFSRLPSSHQAAKEPDAVSRQVWAEMGGGLRWVRGHVFLAPLTFAVAVFHLGTAGAFSLLVLLVKDVLDGSNIVFGVVLASSAVGATLASLVAARLTDRFSRRTVMTSAALVTALSVLAAAGSGTVWQLVIAWVVNGAGAAVMLSVGRGFVQRYTPNDRLGRTAIASRMITRTAFVVGGILAGVVAELLSVRLAFVVAGCLHLVGGLLLWRSFRHEPA